MGIFDNLNGVKPNASENGAKLPEGNFQLEVLKCIQKKSASFGSEMFIVEAKVLSSSVPTIAEGTVVAWNQKCDDPKVYLPSLAAFICATLGYDSKEDAAVIAKEISPNLRQFGEAFVNPGVANGFVVNCEVKKVTTRSGHPFMKHTFSRARKPGEQKRKAA